MRKTLCKKKESIESKFESSDLNCKQLNVNDYALNREKEKNAARHGEFY